MKSTIASLAFFFAKTAYAQDCAVDPVVTDPCFKDGANPTCVAAFRAHLAAGGIFKGANTDDIRAAGGAAYADCLETWDICIAPIAACSNEHFGNADCTAAWNAFVADQDRVKDQETPDAAHLALWDAVRDSDATGATLVECAEACPNDKSRDKDTVDGTCKADAACKAIKDKITDPTNANIYASGCCGNTKCKALVTCHFDSSVVPCTAPPPPPAASAGVASTAGGAAALIVAALASLA